MRARPVRCLRGVNEVIEAYELGRATAAAQQGIDPETLEAARSISEALQRQAPEPPPARRTAPRRRTAGTRPPGRTS